MKYKIGLFAVIIVMVLFGVFLYVPVNSEALFQDLLKQADIHTDGKRPWDITVHNKDLYARVLRDGSLGLGEAYMDGWWDCQALDEFFFRVLRSRLDEKVHLDWPTIINFLKAKLINQQSRSRAFEVGQRHYDLGNDLFQCMLDKRMIYSCGYWPEATTLDEAQEHKLELICQKLKLKPGMSVLDIGCGWGGFARYAAEKYGARVTGITISQEQVNHAQEHYKGLPIDIRLQDYRDLKDTFDRIVSVGMFEHVGSKNYREFMQVIHRCLKDDGLFLLHTIGGNVTTHASDAWITTYIFPNGMLPSLRQMSEALEGLLIMEDWHNFGADYDKTLMSWFNQFDKNWQTLKQTGKYDDRFYRMWKYYLLSCAGLFRARGAQLWQIVLSKDGILGGYASIR